jgi:hypothetical protein
VVHNLKTSALKKVAEKRFTDQISSFYQGADYKGKLRYQVSADGDLEKKSLLRRLRHIGFAKDAKEGEKSEAGLAFNEKNKEYLENMLNDTSSFMRAKEKKFVDLLAEASRRLLLEIFEAEEVKVDFRRDEQKPRLRVDWGQHAPVVKDDSCPLVNVFERDVEVVTPVTGGNTTFAERIVEIEAAGLTIEDVKFEPQMKNGVALKCVLELDFEKWKNAEVSDFGHSFRPGKKCKLVLPYCHGLGCTEDQEQCGKKDTEQKDPCELIDKTRSWENFACNANTAMQLEDGMLTFSARRCKCQNIAEGSEY